MVEEDYREGAELSYTTIPESIKEELADICQPKKLLRMKDCKFDPAVPAFHVFGVRPYTYQYMLFELVRKGMKRIAMCTSRQTGKSTACALLALWAAYYNSMPSGLHQNTKVIVISKSEGQAKKLMGEIKKLIYSGDRKMAIRTNGKLVDAISGKLAANQPQTSSQITFVNGSIIKSLAPTDSARGDTADLLIMDEAAFIEEELFYTAFEPMTSAVDGMIIMASTPNGCQGLFYNIFDPLNEKKTNQYRRLWIPWWYIENDRQKADVEARREIWEVEGKIRQFQQEYEAKFTVAEANFFDSIKVDEAIDSTMSEVMEWKSEPCSIGIDYGWKNSKTAITVVSRTPENIVRLRMHYAYPNDGSDVDIVDDVEDLIKRFNVKHVVCDDCSMGYLSNQKMTNMGLPVHLFNFRSDQTAGERNRGYYVLRTKLNTGFVKLTNTKELITELKVLLEIRKIVHVSIKAPGGYNDDRADSLCMACYPFLMENDDEDDLIVNDIELDNKTEKIDPRQDLEWQGLTGEY